MVIRKDKEAIKTVAVYVSDYDYLRSLQSQMKDTTLTDLLRDCIQVYKEFDTCQTPVQAPVVVPKVIQAPNIKFIPYEEPVVKTTPPQESVRDQYSYVEPAPQKSLLAKFLRKDDA